MNRRMTCVLALAVCALLPAAASAMSLAWDSNPAMPGIQEGNGTWDLATPNWTPDGSANLVWNNNNYDRAVLGYTGAASTVTLANNTTINTSGITIVNSGCNIDAGWVPTGAQVNFDNPASSTSSGSIDILWTSNGAGPWFDGRLSFTKNLDVNGTVTGTDPWNGYSTLYLWNDSPNPNNYSGTLTINSGMVTPSGGGGGAAGIFSPASPGTIVKNSGTLQIIYKGNYNVPPLTLNGFGVHDAHGALQFWPRNDNGPINWQSPIILDSDSGIATWWPSGNAEFKVSGVISETAGKHNALWKMGSADLTLAAANTYSGATVVAEGKLILAATGSIAGSPVIDVRAGATLDVLAKTGGFGLSSTQILRGNGTVLGDIVAAGGSLVEPGASVGTLTITGNLSLGGTLHVQYDSGANAIDQLLVSGTLDVSSASLSFSDIAASPVPLTQPAYVFATYGTLTGTVPAANISGVPAGYSLDYHYGGGNSIALVVPEPSMFVLLALAGLVAPALRRNRKA
ncbi:MAG: hypothetical protein IT426_03305 [Pirellulales bacterium]|nr:hypothetical protein [Pirellulales bacterium]